MQVDTKAIAENLREIAKRPSLGTFGARATADQAAPATNPALEELPF